MAQYRITQDARADIVDILWHSQVQFGLAATRQYQGLILATLDAIANQPDRNGSYDRDEIGPGLRSLHLVHCLTSSPAGRTQRPRHMVLYRLGADAVVEVVRLLHDTMEIQHHPPPG